MHPCLYTAVNPLYGNVNIQGVKGSTQLKSDW